MELMQGIGIIALGVVFALAAIAKLVDREGTRQGLIEFGVPLGMAPVAARMLPLAEALVALAILVPATTRMGAAGAAVLMGSFTVVVGWHLARGRRPGCRCFGQLGDAAIGPRTLLRNVVLLALAVGVAGWADVDATSKLARAVMGTGWIGLLVLLNVQVAAAVAWFGLRLWQQQGRLMQRLALLESARIPAATSVAPEPRAALAPGSFAPDFTLPALSGGQRNLHDLLEPGRSTLLLFFDAACGPCDAMLRRVGNWQRSHAGRLRIVPVFSGEEEAVRARAKIHRLDDVLLQQAFEVGEAYGVPGTPGAILLNGEGRVQSPVMAGEASITRLIDAIEVPTAKPLTLEWPANGGRRAEPVLQG